MPSVSSVNSVAFMGDIDKFEGRTFGSESYHSSDLFIYNLTYTASSLLTILRYLLQHILPWKRQKVIIIINIHT